MTSTQSSYSPLSAIIVCMQITRGRALGLRQYRGDAIVERGGFFERWVVRGVFEPHESLHGSLDPLEIASGDYRRYLPVVSPEHEHDRCVERQQRLVDVERTELVPQMVERELVALSELDEVPQIR